MNIPLPKAMCFKFGRVDGRGTVTKIILNKLSNNDELDMDRVNKAHRLLEYHKYDTLTRRDRLAYDDSRLLEVSIDGEVVPALEAINLIKLLKELDEVNKDRDKLNKLARDLGVSLNKVVLSKSNDEAFQRIFGGGSNE